MSLVTLADVLQPALRQGYAVAGLVTLGWEDMCAFVAAAEAELCPVILQAGPGCRAHTPLPVLGLPGWWPANEAPAFYADPQVFRPARVLSACTPFTCAC